MVTDPVSFPCQTGLQATAYLNGVWDRLENLRISPLDRGFLFGDGVYEVIPAYQSRPMFMDRHLIRLQTSLDGIGLANPHDHGQWQGIIHRLAEANGDGNDDQSIYLHISRGPHFPRQHAFPPNPQPTIFAMSLPLPKPSPETLDQGVAVVTHPDTRWSHCDLKTTALLPSVLLSQWAREHEAMETLLTYQDQVLEGSASSVFVVLDGQLLTPPQGPRILPGITRDLVLELAEEHGFPHQTRPIALAELQRAEEIWLASTTKEITPVCQLDGAPVGKGEPGPVHAKFHAYYQQKIRDLCHEPIES